MDISDFYKEIEKILDCAPGSILGNESFFDNRLFDSISTLELIAFLDKKYEKIFSQEQLIEIGTISNLFSEVSS